MKPAGISRKHRTTVSTAALPVLLCAALLLSCAGCRRNVEPDFPPVTVVTAKTTEATDDPYVIATDLQPTATPYQEIPISFADINFENAVREVLGRNIGNIYPSDLQGIKTFTARVSGIVDIREIVYFTDLEALDLMGNRINDLSPIAELKKLRVLNVARNFTIMTGDREKGLDISPLGALPLLETLDASNNLITDISALNTLDSLKWLDIQNNRLSSTDGLSGCVQLEYLNISSSYHVDKDNNSAGIKDISALASLTNLKTLHMRNGLVASLEPLSGLENLTFVDATYNALRTLPDMSGMLSLKTLVLRFNNLLSLRGLAGQPSVTVLDVRDNFLRNIGEILEMPALDTVYLDGNPIVDYRPLDIFEAIKHGTYVAPETEPHPVTVPPLPGEETPVDSGSSTASPEAPNSDHNEPVLQ